MNYAIISTNVKDEEDYLDEWVTYHLAIGFDHIIIYDHRSKVPVKPIWGDSVSVILLDRDSFMLPEYIHNETLKNFPSFWMIVLDADEFIVLFDDKDIKSILKNYETNGALAVPWSIYGSSGHMTKPKGGVKDNYLFREPYESTWVKSFINTQFCIRTDDPHRGIYTRPSVNEAHEQFEGPKVDSPRVIIRINHYFTKSYEEYLCKIRRGTGDKTPPRPEGWFNMVNAKAVIFDDILKDFGK